MDQITYTGETLYCVPPALDVVKAVYDFYESTLTDIMFPQFFQIVSVEM